VSAFRGANDSLGTLVLNFDTEEELKQALNNQRNWLNVSVMGKNTPQYVNKKKYILIQRRILAYRKEAA
jgi:hypothetical protein